MSQLLIENVDKFYGSIDTGVHAVKNISLEVNEGDIISLLGSSGCGKTTTLRMVAGFEEVSRGRILIKGHEVQELPPVKRNVAMAFEGYSLYPPLTVRDNIAFALKSSGQSSAEISKQVDEVAAMLEITDILGRYPSSISGGQQQRASLARALVRPADLYLLDEPMGQLEPQLRTLLRGRIKHYIKERGYTAILVTHDQTEANALSDKIAVMEGGVLQQYGTPEDIKEQPANLFTGTFVGEPPMNVFPAKFLRKGEKIRFDLGHDAAIEAASKDFDKEVLGMLGAMDDLYVGIRPYAIHRTNSGSKAKVVVNQWLGDQSHIAAEFAGSTIVLVEHERADLNSGDTIHFSINPEDIHVFEGKSGRAVSHGHEVV